MEIDIDMVGDFDERDAFIYPVILAVEHHCTFDFARTGPCFTNLQIMFFLQGLVFEPANTDYL